MKLRAALAGDGRVAALGLAGLAIVYRVVLTRMYYGSEEEDYGNLGLILGTLQSHFTYVETEHMPLFTALAAAATAITGNAEVGGELVAVLSGGLVVGVTTWIGWRWLSPAAGLIAGLVVAFQPDSALTAATPLRISTFVALSMLGIALVGGKRPIVGALALAAAFLTRFDLAFTLLPALAILAAGRRDRPHAVAVGIVGATVAGWAAFYRAQLGTFAFWGSVAERSTEGTEQGGGGGGTLVELLTGMVLPHVGYAVVLAAPVGLFLALRSGDGESRFRERRWLALCGAAVVGFFCLTVVISGYRWDHNLFWKWMCASVPLLALFGAHALAEGGRQLVRRLPGMGGRVAAGVAAAAVIAVTTWSFGGETTAQLHRSDTWYGTQVRLMNWLEDAYPEDVGLVADLIPATYLSRTPNERNVLRWSGDEVPEGLDRAAFGAWLAEERISLVVTFEEEWVGVGRKAPWLTSLLPARLGPVHLEPIAMEQGYGFVAWQVEGAGIPQPSSPPPLDAGAVRVVVEPAD